VVGAERLAASIAVELVTAGAKHLAARGIGTGPNLQEGVAAIFVVLEREAFEKRVASGAGSGSKLLFHISMLT